MAEKGGGRAKRLRCAIYTRKSSDEGLEQEFNSLHAQREACEAFIASQRHEGWHVLSAHYDDGGFSGGTMDRPALQRLLGDIGAGKVDVVVVYKIDRLTRSLFDFAKIVEAFDAKGVSFVSVTQQFNTTTSMGRLTLNVLLSFAQFEREVTSERIRDKIAASKQKGMWMGGAVPLGYDAVNRKLRINAEEAKTVRLLFELYLKLGSVRQLQEECQRRGLRTKLRTMLDGRQSGGTAFSRGHLYRILSNPIYIGRIPHSGRSYEGEHEAIIDAETWDKVQAQLATNAGRKRGRASSKHPSLLAGLLFTAEGVPFTPSHAVNHGRRYRYYVERSLLTPEAAKGKSTGHQRRRNRKRLSDKGLAPSRAPDRAACLETGRRIPERSRSAARCAPLQTEIAGSRLCLTRPRIQAGWTRASVGSFASYLEIVAALVRRITVAQDQVTIEIGRDGLADRLLGQEAPLSFQNEEPSTNLD